MKASRPTNVMILIAETKRGTVAERAKLRKATSSTLGRDSLGRPWRIEPLFPKKDNPSARLKRFFRISGSLDAPPQHWDKVGFEIAYRLRDATGFQVSPDLPSSHFAGPDAAIVPPEAAGADTPMIASGFGSPDANLPGSNVITWALDSIRARQAWALPPASAGGKAQGEGVMVAHPDTGYTNPPNAVLTNFNFSLDWDFLGNDNNALDPLEQTPFIPILQPGHGTLSSSVLVGSVLPPLQGAAPRASLVPLRVTRSVWLLFDSDVARAVNYARSIGAHVISMSLGGEWFSALEEAVSDAVASGMIVVAAAGNYVRFVVAPAAYPDCIAVSAVNINDIPWVDASLGSKVAFCAPGESVWAAGYVDGNGQPRLENSRHTGTTFAAALTAGVAALWLAHHGRNALIARYGAARVQSVFLHLVRTVGHRRPAGWDTANYGAGILDATALLNAPLPDPVDVQDAGLEGIMIADGGAPGVPGVPSVPVELAALFPRLGPTEIRSRLALLLGAQDAELDAKIDRYKAELVRTFTEKRSAWDAFMAMMVQVGDQPVIAGAGPGIIATGQITQFMSPTFRANN